MDNFMQTAAAGNLPAARSLPEIEADILAQKRTIGASIVFIGRALIEAKTAVPHGAWKDWLENRVEFSVSSAENYMRIAREFGEDSKLLTLPYSKVLALLPVPAQERETFADANNVEDKSVAEIKRLVKERDEAKAYAKTQREQYIKESERADALAKEKRFAYQRIHELENRKPETKIVEKEIIPEDYESVKTALADAKDIIDMVEQERDAALEELEAEKMADHVQDPLDVTPFCDACSALLNKLYAAPYAKAMMMTKTEIELKRYETNVRLILEWAVKVQDMIDAVQTERFGEECVFSVV